MQGLALIELACNSDGALPSEMQTCKALVQDAMNQLTELYRAASQTSAFSLQSNSKILDAECVTLEEDSGRDSSEAASFVEITNRTFQRNFGTIIGCQQAKCALYENVILPFTMSPNMRSSLFQGTDKFIACTICYSIYFCFSSQQCIYQYFYSTGRHSRRMWKCTTAWATR